MTHLSWVRRISRGNPHAREFRSAFVPSRDSGGSTIPNCRHYRQLPFNCALEISRCGCRAAGDVRCERKARQLIRLLSDWRCTVKLACWVPPARVFLSWLALSLIVIGYAARPASAQVLYGSVVGTLTDETGAVVPKATVTVTNTSTGLSRGATTNDAGYYSIPNLPEGSLRPVGDRKRVQAVHPKRRHRSHQQRHPDRRHRPGRRRY